MVFSSLKLVYRWIGLGMGLYSQFAIPKCQMKLNDIYFWTATITDWQHLLSNDLYKDVIINSLRFLSSKRKVDVYGFVLMPNHIHLLWRMLAMNGKETPMGSLLKYTAHIFKKMLKNEKTSNLEFYKVWTSNKQFEFWMPDTVAIPVMSNAQAGASLNYIHFNPLQSHWKLVTDPNEYKYSSARFYNAKGTEFPFLKNVFKTF